MSKWIKRMMQPGCHAREGVPAPPSDLAANRRTARALCVAIDRALEKGLHDHAERLAAAAVRLLPEHPPLAERAARLRLGRGEPERALSIIESCFYQCASLRLLRAVCLLQTGRIAEAHLDLHRWAGRAAAPLPARLLLSLLDWQAGDRETARDTLRRNLRQLEDPATLTLMMLMTLEQDGMDCRDESSRWADRLRRAASFSDEEPAVELMTRSLGLSTADRSTREAGPAQVAALATELAACESVIPALAAAQACRPDPMLADLLRRATERALPELAAPEPALEALASLSLVVGDTAAACRWSQRALEASPMSTSAARLASRCHEAARRRETGPDVLARIGRHHQDDPDHGKAA